MKKNPGCVAAIAAGVLATSSSLAVEHWGAVIFWSILISALAVSVGLLTMEGFEAYREHTRDWLPVLYGVLAGAMGAALDIGLWQMLLLVVGSWTVVKLLVNRIRPVPESPRDNAA